MKLTRRQLKKTIQKELLREVGPRAHPHDPSATIGSAAHHQLMERATEFADELASMGYDEVADMAWDIYEVLETM